MKIIYVDFCGTLTTSSTLYKFSKFVFLRHSVFTRVYFFIYFCFSRYTRLLDINLFRPFNNFSVEKLNQYAELFFKSNIQPHINYKTIQYINDAIKSGYYVVIISGGLKNYIKHINNFVKIDKIIAKEFLVKNNQIKPEFKGGSVFQIDKFFQIYEFEKQIEEEITDRIVISDSEDDIPLFLIANKKVVVNPSSKRLIAVANHFNWELL